MKQAELIALIETLRKEVAALQAEVRALQGLLRKQGLHHDA